MRDEDVRTDELRRVLNAVVDQRSVGRVIAVMGDPGMGKSHLLAAVARERQWSELPAAMESCDHPGAGRTMDRVRTLLRQARTRRQHSVDPPRLRPRSYPRELIVLDNAHLADEHTIAELCDMASGAAPLIADVVVALRPRQTTLALRDAIEHGVEFGTVVPVELEPLTDSQLMAVASAAPLDLRRRASGNPFALQALVALADRTYKGAPVGLAPFEVTVLHEIVDLTVTERRVLHSAVVLRSSFDTLTLAEVAELDSTVVESAVDGLLRRDLLRVESSGRLTVRDETFSRLLHRTIDPLWLACAHQRALRYITDGGLESDAGFHLLNSSPAVRSNEMHRIIAAALKMADCDATQATCWLTSVIAEVPAASELGIRARLVLSSVLGQMGRLIEGRDLLLMVNDSAEQTPSTLAPHVASAAIVEGLLSVDDQMYKLLTVLLNSWSTEHDSAWATLVMALHFRHAVSALPCEPSLLAEATRVVLAVDDRGLQSTFLGIRALEHIRLGDSTAASEALGAAGAILDQLDDRDIVPVLPGALLLVLANVYLGRFHHGRRFAARAIDVANNRQHSYLIPTLFVMLSECERQLGRLPQAIAAADIAIVESGAGNGFRQAQALALKSQAEIWHQPVGSGRAKEFGQRALAQSRSSANVNGCAAVAAVALAKTAWLDGNPQHCITMLLSEGNGDDLIGIPVAQRAPVWELLCVAAMDAGVSVADWLWRIGEHAERWPLAHNLAFADICRAHSLRQSGNVAAAVRTYDKAAQVFADADMYVEQAYALGLSARALDGGSDRVQIAERVALAKEVARRCEAHTLAHWLSSPEEAARPAAATSRAVLDGLTPREHEIALLVGGGIRRRDIATRLSISLRTVDVHLTRIYRKTGTGSMVQLALAVTHTDTSERPTG